jgi:hypothetical protein
MYSNGGQLYAGAPSPNSHARIWRLPVLFPGSFLARYNLHLRLPWAVLSAVPVDASTRRGSLQLLPYTLRHAISSRQGKVLATLGLAISSPRVSARRCYPLLLLLVLTSHG